MIYRSLIPVLTLLMGVILVVMPWGLSDTGRLALALVPGNIIFYWRARGQTALSVFSVFVSGLVLDVLGGSPFGYWALVYLVAYGACGLLLRLDLEVLGVRAIVLPGVIALMMASLVVLEFHSMGGPLLFWRIFLAGAIAVLTYPVVCALLWVLDRPSNRRKGAFEGVLG